MDKVRTFLKDFSHSHHEDPQEIISLSPPPRGSDPSKNRAAEQTRKIPIMVQKELPPAARVIQDVNHVLGRCLALLDQVAPSHDYFGLVSLLNPILFPLAVPLELSISQSRPLSHNPSPALPPPISKNKKPRSILVHFSGIDFSITSSSSILLNPSSRCCRNLGLAGFYRLSPPHPLRLVLRAC